MKATAKATLLALMLSLSITCITGCDLLQTVPGAGSTQEPSDKESETAAAPLGSETLESGTSAIGGVNAPVSSTVQLELKGNSFAVSRSGCVTVQGNALTIIQGGRYEVSGTLTDGQLRVCVEKTEKVELVFAGVSITNSSSAPLYVESADKVTVFLKAGTENTLTDAVTYRFPEGKDKPNACLYSSEDLTIEGEGKLIVNAKYNNGIASKNDLKIKGGDITVTAANNALKGNQSVLIQGGSLRLQGADGIKSDSLLENEGWIEILGGTLELICSDDGIQAPLRVVITADASVTVRAADKDVNCDGMLDIANGSLISK